MILLFYVKIKSFLQQPNQPLFNNQNYITKNNFCLKLISPLFLLLISINFVRLFNPNLFRLNRFQWRVTFRDFTLLQITTGAVFVFHKNCDTKVMQQLCKISVTRRSALTSHFGIKNVMDDIFYKTHSLYFHNFYLQL